MAAFRAAILFPNVFTMDEYPKTHRHASLRNRKIPS